MPAENPNVTFYMYIKNKFHSMQVKHVMRRIKNKKNNVELPMALSIELSTDFQALPTRSTLKEPSWGTPHLLMVHGGEVNGVWERES